VHSLDYKLFYTAQQHILGQGLLIVVASLSHWITQTNGRIPLEGWSARRRDLYLATTTHNWQTSMPSAEFDPKTPASERSQNHIFDNATTGIGSQYR